MLSISFPLRRNSKFISSSFSRGSEKVSSIFSSSSVVAVDDGDGVTFAAAAAIVSTNASSRTFILSFATLRSSAYFARYGCDLIKLIKEGVMNANAMIIFRVLLPLLLGLFSCDMAAGYSAVTTGTNCQ